MQGDYSGIYDLIGRVQWTIAASPGHKVLQSTILASLAQFSAATDISKANVMELTGPGIAIC
jgi:sarcosine oxidase gamma subunit